MNAIKYSNVNSIITIKGLVENSLFIIRIKDEGSGFEQKPLESVFNFFQSDEIMHHKEGFGLGLATSQMIMELHRGYIKARNHESGGAEIQLYFELN